MFQILLWSPWKYRCGQRTVRMAVMACSQSKAVFARRRSKSKPKRKLLDIRAELERKEKERERSKKEDLRRIASELELCVSDKLTVLDLMDLIKNCDRYKNDPDSVHELANLIIEERKYDESQQLELIGQICFQIQSIENGDKFVESLQVVNDININRCIVVEQTEVIELHGFSDASQSAYGAVVYCKSITSDGKMLVHLIASKSRVAPTKQTTIPRLEL
ncbi:integrase_H2C2 domain-containing protein [Trichonephila clavipes]|nr:integrase_H2C2 domain-containing protein [Trichonephila clavipes]